VHQATDEFLATVNWHMPNISHSPPIAQRKQHFI